MDKAAYRVHLCCGPTCSRFNPKELLAALEEEVALLGLEDQVSIQLSACRNRCEQSPSLNVYPGPVCYNRLTPDAVRAIARQHLTGGEPVDEFLFQRGRKPVTPGSFRPVSVGQAPAGRKRSWWS